MSILTDALEGKITFNQAATEAEQWAQKLISHDPTLTAAAGTILTDVKQAASTAVGLVDTYVGTAVLPAAKGVEVALDAALAEISKGVSIPFNGFVNDGIDTMANAIVAEAHAWALRTKAQLAPTAAAQ